MNRLRHCLAAAAMTLALAPSTAATARAAGPEASASAAERLANEAYEQHAAGKYAEAIATYLKAYEISKAGAILFNVATIYDRKLGERGLAEDYYRRYLAAADVEPGLVKKATERLTALKREDDAEAARSTTAVAPVTETPPPAAPSSTPAPIVAPPPSPAAPATAPMASAVPPSLASPGRPLRTAGVVVGVVGVVGVGASMVLGLVAKGKNDDANAICNGPVCSSDRGVSLAKDAGTFATASTVSFVSGLALLGTGVALFVLAPKDPSSAPVARITVAPQVGMTGLGMNVGGSF